MIRRLGTWVFLIAAAAAGGILWTLSAETWGRSEDYAITAADTRNVGSTVTWRISVQPIKGAKDRQPLEVPKEIYEKVGGDNNQLHIQTRFIPVLQGELVQYSILRAGMSAVQWDEGWPFYGFALFVGSFFAGGVAFGIYLWLAAVLRLKPPSE